MLPLACQGALAFDDQDRFARDDEEAFLIGLLVVQRHRLARPEHKRIDTELFESPRTFEVISGEARLRVYRDFPEELEPQVLRCETRAAVPEDIGPFPAVRAGEVTHVLDDAKDRHVQLVEHRHSRG